MAWLLNENLSARDEISSYELWFSGVPEALKQVIAIVFSYLPRLDGKTPLLKRSHTLVTVLKKNMNGQVNSLIVG